ncbi:MAG: hypothetical protein H7832_14795, partial [Magnetococcus sp. DMHC-6]
NAVAAVPDKTITVTAATDGATTPIANVQNAVAAVPDKTIMVTAATEGAATPIAEVKEAVEAVPDKNVTVTAQTEGATTPIAEVKEAVDTVPDKKLTSVNVTVSSAIRDLNDVQSALFNIVDRSINITALTSGALNSLSDVISSLAKIQDKTITITTFHKSISLKASGGLTEHIARFASGGAVFRPLYSAIVPGVGSGDTVPAALRAGSYVIRKSAANYYGGGFLRDLLSKKIPRFALGGLVDTILTPGEWVLPPGIVNHYGYGFMDNLNHAISSRMPSPPITRASGGPIPAISGQSSKTVNVNLNVGGGKYPVVADEAVANGLVRALEQAMRRAQ